LIWKIDQWCPWACFFKCNAIYPSMGLVHLYGSLNHSMTRQWSSPVAFWIIHSCRIPSCYEIGLKKRWRIVLIKFFSLLPLMDTFDSLSLAFLFQLIMLLSNRSWIIISDGIHSNMILTRCTILKYKFKFLPKFRVQNKHSLYSYFDGFWHF
jgi:hypothetical protein